MPGNWGGARPGAGRKSADTEAQQLTHRDQLLSHVTDERWAAIVDKALDQAEAGDRYAREFLAAWILGAKPKEVDIFHHDDVAPVAFTDLPWMDAKFKAERLARQQAIGLVIDESAPVIDGQATLLLAPFVTGQHGGNGHNSNGRS